MRPRTTPDDRGTPSLFAGLRLTEAQRRNLAEMHVQEGDAPMYWTTRRGSAQYRCAVALAKKGLVEASGDHSAWSFNNPGFVLTERGVGVARELAS